MGCAGWTPDAAPRLHNVCPIGHEGAYVHTPA